MSAPCHGKSRVCSYHQDRGLCGRCPNRQQVELPRSLQPFSTRTLLILLTVMLVVYQLVCIYQERGL